MQWIRGFRHNADPDAGPEDDVFSSMMCGNILEGSNQIFASRGTGHRQMLVRPQSIAQIYGYWQRHDVGAHSHEELKPFFLS